MIYKSCNDAFADNEDICQAKITEGGKKMSEHGVGPCLAGNCNSCDAEIQRF